MLFAVYHVIVSDVLLENCINYPERIVELFNGLYG